MIIQKDQKFLEIIYIERPEVYKFINCTKSKKNKKKLVNKHAK